MKQKAKCVHAAGGYEHQLTEGKIYEVEQVEGIFETRPLYVFINDNGNKSSSHLYRFELLGEGEQENG